MNLYSISTYREVVLYIDEFLGVQMWEGNHPIQFGCEDDNPDDVYFFISGRLVFQEITDKIIFI